MEALEIALDSCPFVGWPLRPGVFIVGGQGCVVWGMWGSRLRMLKRRINGLCILPESVLEFNVFEENQIWS